MKRHPALLQLSREHHTALKLALDCRKAALAGQQEALDNLCAKVSHLFASELEPHFCQEEESLLPELAAVGERELVAQTLQEHAQLRSLAQRVSQGDRAALEAFSAALTEHVRFEERELFERAQHYPAFAAPDPS